MKPIKIVILIPIHNSLNYTKKTLKYIYNSIACTSIFNFSFDVVIIDDGSSDGSAAWINENYPNIHLITGNGDLWWSGSINRGIDYSLNQLDPNYFLLFNNDLEIKENYFNCLIAAIDENDKNTIIVSKVYYLDEPNKVFSMGAKFNYFTGVSYILNYKYTNKYNVDQKIEVDWFGGMGVLIPKIVIDDIGYFDEYNFPQYKGDFDYALRVKKKGYKIIAHPKLEIWNDTSHTGLEVIDFSSFIKSFTDQKSQMNIYENIKFYSKHALPVIGYYGIIKKYLKHIGKYIFIKLSALIRVEYLRF